VTHFVERIACRNSPDTLCEIRARTREELVAGVAAVIEKERAAGEVVTWQDDDRVIAPSDASKTLHVTDGAYLVAALRLRLT
jgi:hypothetical protein